MFHLRCLTACKKDPRKDFLIFYGILGIDTHKDISNLQLPPGVAEAMKHWVCKHYIGKFFAMILKGFLDFILQNIGYPAPPHNV